MGKSSSVRRAISGRAKLARMAISDHTMYQVIRSVSKHGLTFLGAGALIGLHEGVNNVEINQLDGILVEAGCALGGSAIVMAKSKTRQRPIFLYDVFGMIPPPSTRDHADAHERYQEITSGQARGIKDGEYYGYEENLLAKVEESFEAYDLPLTANNIHLVQGLYEETLIIDQPVALAHIDCDWYDSVMTCLEQIVPWLVPGGMLIIDDYEEWSGCRKAVDDFFAPRGDDFTFTMKSRLHITRANG